MQNQHIVQIEKEYARIEDRWMEMHKKINLGLAMIAFGVELVMFFVLHKVKVISATVPVYILKYLVLPTLLNLMLVGFLYVLFQKYGENRVLKRYAVSLCLVAICFVLLTVHNIFSSLHMLFGIPVILTTIYGDYRLSTTTALLSMAGKVAGELLIVWDPDKVSILKNQVDVINFVLSLVILLGFYAVSLVIIYYERQKNGTSIKKELERYKLRVKLMSDNLTSLYNRAALRKHLNAVEGSKDAFIFVMVDVDDFKKVNDTLGHVIGDEFLKAFADILKTCSCPHPAFRFGGDEFCLLFKNESLEKVLEICGDIQRKLSNVMDLGEVGGVTASFGIACYDSGITVNKLVEHADRAMYQSKKNKGSISIYGTVKNGDSI